MSGPATAPPARGTRPRNRRALILAAASDLFVERGYDRINVGDIAQAVAIGPSALYRHFSGKQDLLREVIADGLRPVRALTDDLDREELAAIARRLATMGIDERHIGVLWQRESRRLAPADRTRLRSEIRDLGARLAALLRTRRPDLAGPAASLLAWAAIAVMISPSFHRLDLPRPRFDEVLGGLIAAVLTSPVPVEPGPRAAAHPALARASRREAMLTQAVRMFAADGYAAIGIEDIGAAVGITGASIYGYFPSKLDLLSTAMWRGGAVLFTGLAAAYETASTPAEALTLLIGSYVDFTQTNPDLVGLLITDTDHLTEDDQRAVRRTQRDYVAEWVHLLGLYEPTLDPTEAGVRVHAALGVANDLARIPDLHGRPGIRPAVESVCRRVLGMPEATS